MLIFAAKFVAVLVAAVFDRLRGDEDLGLHWKTADALIMGLAIGFCTYGTDWKAALILAPFSAASIAMSYKNHWGAFTGKRAFDPGRGLSWWEKIIPVGDNIELGLVVRGLIGAVVVMGHAFFVDDYSWGPAVGVLAGFTIAPKVGVMLVDDDLVPEWLGKRFNILKPNKERWNVSEFCRGFVNALTSWVL